MSYFPPLFLSFYISDTAPAHIRKSIKFRWDYHLIIEKLVQNSFHLLLDDLPSSYDISNYGSILVFPGLCPRQSDGSGSEPRYHWSSWRIGYICNKKSQKHVFFVTLELTTMLKYRLTAAHYKIRSYSEVSPIYLGKLNQPILNFIYVKGIMYLHFWSLYFTSSHGSK